MRPNTRALARRIERRMTARVSITEPGPPGPFDPDTGTYPPGPPIVHYEGKAYVRPTRLAAREAESVGQYVTLYSVDVMVPVSVPAPDPAVHTVTVTAAGDPQLAGVKLTITRVQVADDWATARLLVCERSG